MFCARVFKAFNVLSNPKKQMLARLVSALYISGRCRNHARPVAFPPLLPLDRPVAHSKRMRSTSCSQPARR